MSIEKLPDSFTPRRNQWDDIVDHPSPLDILAKLNEVIEAVNRLEERPVFANPSRDPNAKNVVSAIRPL